MNEKKTCTQCGYIADESIKFCPNCGSNNFREFDPDETAILTPDDSPFNQNPTPQQQTNFQNAFGANQPYQSSINPSNTKKKKGLKGWQIVLIVLGVLILAGIGFAAEKTFQQQGYGKTDSTTSSNNDSYVSETEKKDTKDNSVAYSKGIIDGDYYINEWANLKFKMSDEWYDIPEAHSNYEAGKEECGFAFMNQIEGRQFVISFEDLSSYIYIDNNQYLDAVKNSLSGSWANSGLTCLDSKEGTIRIAGQEYVTLDQSLTNANGASFKFKVCTRVQDKRAIVLMFMVQNETQINDVLNNIYSVE